MNTYETTAIVEYQGQVHVDGVPFAPGTEVEVTIRPKAPIGLHWEGNVLGHQGVGAGLSVAELQDERLERLGQGQPE